MDVFDDRDDVSGDKYGIRCEGDGCGYDHGTIDVMEIHTNEHYHYSMYSLFGRGWDMLTACSHLQGKRLQAHRTPR